MKPRIVASILVAVGLAGAATIVTVRGPANVYPTEQRRVYERPLYILDKGEVVEVLKWGSPLTKIRNRKGRQGWVEPAKLDSLNRPPILNLVIDTEEIATPAVTPVNKRTAKSVDSGVVKKWNAAKPSDSLTKPTEKSVDFPGDTAHITAQSKSDSAK
jgi:hypothetical protein